MKRNYQPVFLLLSITFCFHADKFQKEDILILAGNQWKGKLTYLDYSTNKKTTIPANLLVQQAPGNKNTFYFIHEYPKESHANNTDTISISRDGKMFGDEKFLTREKIGNMIKLVSGRDFGSGEEMKQFRYTYLISSNLFSIRKEEKGSGDTSFFIRNVYEYNRK